MEALSNIKERVPAMAMSTPERDLEESLVTKLQDLKYEYRPDISGLNAYEQEGAR